MKRRNEYAKRGVVLLMILGLMAMFAISVLSYMIVTSNMAETAQNAQKIDETREVPTINDVNYALKNVLLGSDNESNPIAPFSILENMYGDWKDYSITWDNDGNVTSTVENSATEFRARIAIFPHLGYAVLVPTRDFNNNDILHGNYADLRDTFTFLFENSGGVLTFKEAMFSEEDVNQRRAPALWNSDVCNTSAFILEKVVTNPRHPVYLGSNSPTGSYWAEHYMTPTEDLTHDADYADFDFWHFKVELTDDLKKFVSDYIASAPTPAPSGQLLDDFNRGIDRIDGRPEVIVRLNRPAYSGTGVGGFSPGDKHDASISPQMIANSIVAPIPGAPAESLRVPFLFWANAAAPDFHSFRRTYNDVNPSFRSYWAHLTDLGYNLDLSKYYSYNNTNGVPVVGGSGYSPESVRVNVPYTAVDNRSLFLGRVYLFDDGAIARIIPSFHRPSLFQTLVAPMYPGGPNYLRLYANAYSSIYNDPAVDQLMVGILRKLTPRPLPFDHWNFTGGNPRFDYHNPAGISIDSVAQELAGTLTGPNGEPYEWDVDNDGDGVRDGIWVPSGLPIRYDDNGVPYATMLSYLVLDMDGRVNVNTAGTWDQLPNKMRNATYGTGYSQPYDYVEDIADLWNNAITGGVNVGTPFSEAENLSAGFGWLDDSGAEYDNVRVARGEGRGSAELRLYDTLRGIFNPDLFSDDDVIAMTSNILWRRYQTYANKRPTVLDTGALTWGVNGLSLNGTDVPQPGFVHNGSEVDDAMGTRYEAFRFNDPIRLLLRSTAYGDCNGSSASIGEAKVIFPWRGKTTVSMSTLADMAPAFDYAGSALRTYDPLGNQVYSYAPRYSNNPYFAYQNVRTLYDSPYGLTMLERLIRRFDPDVVAMEPQLYDDLRMNAPSNNVREIVNARRKAQYALTTISSDVPSPSLAFPENFKGEGENRYGNYGFVDLIRRNVRAELRRVFEVKGICEKTENGVDSNGNKIYKEGTNELLDAYPNSKIFERKVEEITQYLTMLLPKEILVGEKIDLNALAQKNYWLDVEYDNNGDAVPANDNPDNPNSDTHNVGLLKRMEYARGLYLVVMTLLYEDMNGKTLYEQYDPDNKGVDVMDKYEVAINKKLADYIEGSFDLLKIDGAKKDEKRDLMARELMATRIAQWCVNVVDFADPDATMTPFFFDPTPFDGWWIEDSDWIDGVLAATTKRDPVTGEQLPANKWQENMWEQNDDPALSYLFAPSQGVPTENMYDFFYDALVNSDKTLGPDSVYRDKEGNALVGCPEEPDWVDDPDNWVQDPSKTWAVSRPLRSNEIIALWMKRKIEKLEDQTSDLGFRLVWGMERPDLLLTETLNFHDLGIAKPTLTSDLVSDKNKHFDQVRRPKGSTYLELYCASNPNVPQSDELYFYDVEAECWKLRLSRLTPSYIDSQDRILTMPIWRIAISDSTDVCGLYEPKKLGRKDENQNKWKSGDLVYHKRSNSVLAHLTPQSFFVPDDGNPDGGEDKCLDDLSFFSMQPRQFRNLPINKIFNDIATYNGKDNVISDIATLDLDQGVVDGKIKRPMRGQNGVNLNNDPCLFDWLQFDLYASNVLGPAVAEALGGELARVNEIELDRVVWFSAPENVDSSKKIPVLAEYPDSLRTFYPNWKHPDNSNATIPGSNAVVLAPNQYLVVGPEKTRSISSIAFNSTSTNEGERRYGKPMTGKNSLIDISGLDKGFASEAPRYLVAYSYISDRGLNISEPLWTAQGKNNDPYIYEIKHEEGISDIRDVPFELPDGWGERGSESEPVKDKIASYPIVKDHLFGVGTAPDYKSAFVQRVADPNRPYHPLMNPYITVDWNIMDLTVYTGESDDPTDYESIVKAKEDSFTGEIEKSPEQRTYWYFSEDPKYPFKEGNKIKVARNTALGLDDVDSTKKYELSVEDVFSSRQWGSYLQKAFAPSMTSNRPNPWARAFKVDKSETKAGLEKSVEITGSGVNSPAFRRGPSHTLGHYNGATEGYWEVDLNGNCTAEIKPDTTGTYPGLNPKYLNASGIYKGVPGVPIQHITGESHNVADHDRYVPFEHLVWNDAPYGNPYELLTVPASSAGRFGLEFVRNSSENYDLAKNYDTDKEGSLGSFGIWGFTDWYTDDNVKQELNGAVYHDNNDMKSAKDKNVGAIGPYFNFLASSTVPGETLNLCKILDFVYTPSPFLGTKKLAGRDLNGNLITDESGNPIFRSTRREPGKININTSSGAAWQAFANGKSADWWNDINSNVGRYYDNLDNDPFMPVSAMNLWSKMDRSPIPEPAHASLLSSNRYGDPIFDNLGDCYDRESEGAPPMTEPVGYHCLINPDRPDEQQSWKDIYDDDEFNQWLEQQKANGIEKPEYYIIQEPKRSGEVNHNVYTATAEMQRLSGLTTTRSNVFAVWVTVGYFEVERCMPGVNMPEYDPDGNRITVDDLVNPEYKWFQYYQAIYPDGYTYGRELGSDTGDIKRHRGFSIIDRSIPVDYRRGNSVNYEKTILMKRVLD